MNFKFAILTSLCILKMTSAIKDRPKIKTSEGHLIIEVAADKNITLRTDGFGRVNVNEIDITKAAEISHGALEAMRKYKTNFEASFEKLSKFGEILEANGKYRTNYTYGQIPVNVDSLAQNVRNLNRKITSLRRNVRLMQNLLVSDDCTGDPCRNGGTCVDLYGKYLCHCPPEWEGTTCEKDVNECARFAGTDLGCQNGATCTNRPGSYECQCSHGWFGLHCTRRSTDCNSGSSSEICDHGTCVNQNNDLGYKCICDEGWTTDGKSPACNVDVNECLMSKPSCSVNPPVECINLPGTFHCGACPPGFSGNGYYCTDIDECDDSNGGCSTNPLVQCINTHGSRICGNCPPGYIGNGVACSYQGGVCGVNNGGCHPMATCRDNQRISSTYVECNCPIGYIGNGIGSEGCAPSAHFSNNPCSTNPCIYGTCQNLNRTGNYVCNCMRRYTGRNCDQLRNMCATNPCENGGTCSSILGVRYRCTCPKGYIGTRCEMEQQACGGRLRAESGTLFYPSVLSKTYEHSLSCAWTIETNMSQVLNITFNHFKIEASHDCQFDWLQIHDGKNTLSRSLGRFCGSELPHNGTIISTHNVIYLWFRTDSSIADTGFELTWNSIDPICGEEVIFVTSHGRIESPGTPGNYPNSRDCYWSLIVEPDKRLVFHFYTLMIGDDSNCDHDYLEFISGMSVGDPVFAKYCNTSRPAPLTSLGSEVKIHFHSDESKSYPGFQITYAVVEGLPGCGGVYTMSEGVIRSPSFDGRYPLDLFCEYKIKFKEKSRVSLKFLSFSIESSDGCQSDSVSIFAGDNSGSPLIGRYCGTEIPPPYVSDNNEILVVFKTDWTPGGEGFVLRYEMMCGGRFTSASDVIQSPSYPDFYRYTKTCIYEIVRPLGTAIKLQVTDLQKDFDDIEEAYDTLQCLSYFIFEIRDGDTSSSPLIGRYPYCEKLPSTILSTYNHLWIEFHTGSRIGHAAFQANYTTIQTGCGGILKDKRKTISSTDFPLQSNCKWIISAPTNNVIQIMWSNLHISCATNYLEIFDNNTENNMGGSVGKFCGQNIPPMILSSSNVVTLVYHADQLDSSDEFVLTYSTIHEKYVCGGNYFTNAGIIKSPNFPNNYPPSLDCSWVITVNPGNQIMLNITDFYLEDFSTCRYDSVEIRNGGTSSSPLIGKYCGDKIPKLMPSHTNKIFIYFKSDASKSGKGFRITWDTTATGCGGYLLSPTGSIISPNYPEPYNSNAECIWRISVSAGSLVQVAFVDLELEQDSSCDTDYVELFDGLNIRAKSLGRFCALHPAVIISTGNHMSIKFRSDLSQQGRGFNLRYKTLCNNTVKGFRGIIESPNFPNEYHGQLNCNWEIHVSAFNRINISFSHFQLERIAYDYNNSEPDCIYDYVEVLYAEHDQPFEKYGKYCGHETPPLITLNGDKAKIRFVTDDLLSGIGFRLEWQINGCGGFLKGPKGAILTPNYPQNYISKIECNWLIGVEYGRSVEITFNEIDITHVFTCGFDYIKIYNGEDDSYPLIADICYQTKPTIASSTGNFMYITFRAGWSYKGRRFNATYTTKETKCGGRFTAEKGFITSPNYPKNYDKNDTCGYLIEIREGFLINLKFEDVDLPQLSGVACKDNNESFVTVHDGPSHTDPILAKICGKNFSNETFVSTYNKMFVNFFGLGQGAAKGFIARYQRACGARIETASTGSISLAFTDHSVEEMNCTWTIVSKEPSKHVSLMFSHLQTFYPCYSWTYSYIQIYNGESSDAPILFSHCGSKIPPMITSDGTALHVVAKSTAEFFATYSVYDSFCGGTLIAASGFFTSPGYPRKYPSNVECEWILEIQEGNSVSLSFSDFGLQETEHCNTDYLEIRQKNAHGKLLGVFCGDNAPTNVTSVGGLWMLLKTSAFEEDGDKSLKGFSGEYGLNGVSELSGPFGVIANPMQIKHEEKEIVYKISVEFGKRILLTFKEMNTDEVENGDFCDSGLTVFDGSDEESPSLGQYCGTTIPDPIKSTSNELTILYGLEGLHIYPINFRLEWLQIDSTFDNLNPIVPKRTKKCGSSEPIDLNALKNFTIITSPGYPHGYAPNLDCEWIITTIPMNHIEVYFKDVNLEDLSYSSYSPSFFTDFVEVFQKADTGDWKSIQKISKNNQTSTTVSATNLIKLSFETNQDTNGTGFSAIVRQECGGILTGHEGYIIYNNETSSHYGYRHYGYKKCQWNVTVGSGKTIEVTFTKLNIINEKDQCSNYLILRNGHFPDSPILGNKKYCKTMMELGAPVVLKTTGNTLYVKYAGTVAAADFKIHYREVGYECGGEIILNKYPESAEITTPNYPNIPPPHIECVWKIIGPPIELLRIDFLERFDVAYSKDCTNEFVEVRDGGTVLSPLIGKYCSKTPSSEFTTANMMFVRYFSDLNEPSNGFKARIALDDCGGTIRGNTGRVQSRNFNNPNKYPDDVNCTWHLIAPSGHTMKLEFEKLDLQPSTNCSIIDHVRILEYNRAIGDYSELGSYCDKIPPPLQSSSNEVIVNFVTSKQQHRASGFSLKFNSSVETCGGTLELSQGYIQSPNYPIQHEGHRTCTWTIKVPRGRRVTLEILDSDFQLPAVYLNGLAIYSGPGFNGFIGRIPNDESDQKTFESTDNIMVVYYWTRSHSQRRGFKAKFSSNNPTKCIGDFNSDNGILKQPDKRLISYYCNYLRDTSNDGTLAMTLTIFSNITTKSRECKYPKFNVLLTTQDETTIINEVCWDITNLQIRSPYPINRIIVFQHNYRVEMNYTISYTTYQCGGLVAGETGTITSPNYPNKPSQSYECAWLLRLPKEQTIQVTFDDLDLGDSCDHSYIDVYNGKTPLSPKIGRFCQKNKPQVFKSQENSLWIEYKFDSKDAPGGKGFSFKYEPIIHGCGGVFHDTTRVIQTPNYPKEYPDNAECLWELHADEGYHIGLSFTSRFHLEGSDSCSNDFVEFWDWTNNDWVSFGKICGRDIARTFNSTSNKMKILFRSNDKLSGAGFRAQWEWNCGGTFVADTKERFIVSPGFPKRYNPSTYCEYNITAPQAEYINVHFYDFDLEKSGGDCKFDNLTISNYGYTPFHIFSNFPNHVFCGSDAPPDIRFPGKIYITFRTDKYLQKSGFKFSYALEDCGGTINTSRSIESPNLNSTSGNAELFHTYISCTWNITAPPEKAILIQFEKFHFQDTYQCYFNNVELFEGTSVNLTPRTASLCGDLSENLPEFRSKGNNLIVRMNTERTKGHAGFKASIYFVHSEKEGCGGILNITKQTELTAPNLGAMDCSWNVFGNVGDVIKVTFSKIDLPKSCSLGNNATILEKCNCGFIEIKDGPTSLADSMEKLCGIQLSNSEREIISSTRSVTIRLNLVTAVTQAFKILLTPIQSICGPLYLNVTKEKQILTSPNYPNAYPRGLRCTWILQSNTRFMLHFEDFDLIGMTLEHYNPNACTEDKLQIINDPITDTIAQDHGSQILKHGKKKTQPFFSANMLQGTIQLCGKHKDPFDYYSDFNTLQLNFATGRPSVTKGKGFKLEYSEIGCNRNYTTNQGRIKSLINEDCVITITVEESLKISLFFSQFYLTQSDNCNQVGIEIREGSDKNGKVKLRACGYADPSPIFASSNKLWIHTWNNLETKSSIDNYDLIYTSSEEPKGCGGYFYNYAGRFTSPLYPLPYAKDNQPCTWGVQVPLGMRVALKFSIFDIQGDCKDNYITVTTYSGEDHNEHKFCKDDEPAILYSDLQLQVYYSSSFENKGSGWMALFEALD